MGNFYTDWKEFEYSTSSGTTNYATWRVTIITEDSVTASGSTFTIPYPTSISAYYTGGDSAKNGAYARVPVALGYYTNWGSDYSYFTHPAVYRIGTAAASATSANWSPGSANAKTLEQVNAGVLKSGALTRNTADYFNSSNPTTRTVSLDNAWLIYDEEWKYSSNSNAIATMSLRSYRWRSSGVDKTSQFDSYDYHMNRAEQTGSIARVSNNLKVTLDAPPSVTASPGSTSYNYGDTLSVSYNANAQYGGTISNVSCTINGITKTSTTNSGTLQWSNFQYSGTFTPKITVTDSRGQTTTKDLSPITVSAAQPPTVSLSTDATTYAYGSTIIANVSATAYSGASITNVSVMIGSTTKTSPTGGSISFKNFTEVGSWTPTVTVTDSRGKTATATASRITVQAAKNPTFEVTGPPGGQYDAGTYYAVVVSNVQTYQSSTVSSIVLSVGSASTTTTVAGTISVTLPASGTYTPTVTVTDSDGRYLTKSLDSISIKNTAIYVSNLSTERIDSTTYKPADDGTNGLLTGTFYVQAGKLRLPTVKINGSTVAAEWYKSYDRTTGTFSTAVSTTAQWEAIASGTTLYARIPGTLLANTSYPISVTPNSSVEAGTTITVYLAQQFYLLVGRAGGRALGIGQKPSADNLLEVVMESHFLNSNIKFTGNDGDLHYLIDLIYPVNSYYETSDSSFDPGTLWGGTWTRVAEPGKYIWHRTQ